MQHKQRSYDELTDRLTRIAESPNIRMETIGEFEAMQRVYRMFVLCAGSAGEGKRGVMIAAGIHGDEPAGVEAALSFAESLTESDELLSRFHFVIFPCNNPTGYELNTRENWRGVDLNRQFNVRHAQEEATIISQALAGRCFDLDVEMHEDVDSPGFYMYEIAENSESHIGERIVEAVAAEGYPINLDECIEGMPAHGGIIRRSINLKRFRKTRLPQAIYIYRTCGGHVLTLEPPASKLPVPDRVRIELMALKIAMEGKL